MGKPGNTGLTRIIKAFGFSMQGFKALWQHEAAFRQELMLAVILLPTAFYLARTSIELIVLVMPVFIVLIVEILNSAIEAIVDRVSDEKHELSGRAKDMGSAAVLLSLLLTALVWSLTLYDMFFA